MSYYYSGGVRSLSGGISGSGSSSLEYNTLRRDLDITKEQVSTVNSALEELRSEISDITIGFLNKYENRQQNDKVAYNVWYINQMIQPVSPDLLIKTPIRIINADTNEVVYVSPTSSVHTDYKDSSVVTKDYIELVNTAPKVEELPANTAITGITSADRSEIISMVTRLESNGMSVKGLDNDVFNTTLVNPGKFQILQTELNDAGDETVLDTSTTLSMNSLSMQDDANKNVITNKDITIQSENGNHISTHTMSSITFTDIVADDGGTVEEDEEAPDVSKNASVLNHSQLQLESYDESDNIIATNIITSSSNTLHDSNGYGSTLEPTQLAITMTNNDGDVVLSNILTSNSIALDYVADSTTTSLSPPQLMLTTTQTKDDSTKYIANATTISSNSIGLTDTPNKTDVELKPSQLSLKTNAGNIGATYSTIQSSQIELSTTVADDAVTTNTITSSSIELTGNDSTMHVNSGMLKVSATVEGKALSGELTTQLDLKNTTDNISCTAASDLITMLNNTDKCLISASNININSLKTVTGTVVKPSVVDDATTESPPTQSLSLSNDSIILNDTIPDGSIESTLTMNANLVNIVSKTVDDTTSFTISNENTDGYTIAATDSVIKTMPEEVSHTVTKDEIASSYTLNTSELVFHNTTKTTVTDSTKPDDPGTATTNASMLTVDMNLKDSGKPSILNSYYISVRADGLYIGFGDNYIKIDSNGISSSKEITTIGSAPSIA